MIDRRTCVLAFAASSQSSVATREGLLSPNCSVLFRGRDVRASTRKGEEAARSRGLQLQSLGLSQPKALLSARRG